MKKYLLPLILIICLAFTISGYSANLYGTYDQRIKLTIDNTKVDSDLTWFPVMIKLTSGQMEEVFAEFDSDDDFDRCAITLADESTQIYGDCERFDDSESVAEYHVAKTGVITDADAAGYLYFYYDKDAAHNTTYISKSGGVAGQSVYDANFQAVYHMVGTGENAIDVGNTCADRSSTLPGNVTYIDLANPADYTGKITSVEIWAAISMASAKVATFSESGGKYTARDVSGALGVITQGAKRTFTVNLDVVAGDFIGIYFTDAADSIEATTATGSGVVYLAGDQTACVDATFDLHANYVISLYGTGVEINILDSTSNANHGYKKGTGEPVEAAGKVGQGQDYDGTDDYIDIGAIADIFDGSTTVATFTFLLNADDVGTYADDVFGGVESYGENSQARMVFGYDGVDTDAIQFLVNSGAWADNYAYVASTATVLANATWYHVSGVLNLGTLANSKIYLNGASKTIATGTNGTPPTVYPTLGSNFCLGSFISQTGPTYYDWKGLQDEVRFSDIERNAAWQKAEYNSLWDTLLTYGDEETPTAGANVMFMFSNF